MSTLSLKNVKIQDPTGTLVSTLSYDGTNITIDKPVLAPTASASTNNTQLATTAMVHSAITNDLHVTGSAPMYACRAWVNFDGTQSSSTPRSSGNISSITKNGTGDYTINFTNAMPDANYCFLASGYTSKTYNELDTTPTRTVSAIRIAVRESSSNAYADVAQVSVAIFR